MGNWEFTRFIISLWKLIFYLTLLLSFPTPPIPRLWEMGTNGKLNVCFHTRGGVARWKRETGNCSPTRDARDQVGNGKWEIECGFVEQTKWEMGNGKWPSGKLDVLELPAFGKRETGNWLLNLSRRDILKNTVEGFRSIKTEPF